MFLPLPDLLRYAVLANIISNVFPFLLVLVLMSGFIKIFDDFTGPEVLEESRFLFYRPSEVTSLVDD